MARKRTITPNGGRRSKKRFYKSKKIEAQYPVSRDSGRYYANQPKRWRQRIVRLFLIIVLLTWGYIAVFHSYFQISNISVSGTNRINPEQVKGLVAEKIFNHYYRIPKSNYFLVSTEKIQSLVNDNYILKSVQVIKKFPSSLEIKLEESISAVRWRSINNEYLLDLSGNAILAFENDEQIASYSDIPLLVDNSGADVEIRSTVIDSEVIKSVISLYERSNEQGIGFRSFKVDSRSSDHLFIVTKDGWEVFLNMSDDLDLQYDRLLFLVRNKLKDKLEELSYIDLRFGEKIYYK